MGQFADWVKGDVSTGTIVNSVLSDAGEAIIDGVCSLRAKYPNRFANGGILTPVMDRLCSENSKPLPSPVLPGFTGGQCSVDYYVRLQVNFNEDGSKRLRQKDVPGPISGRLGYRFFGKYGSQNETFGYLVEIEGRDGFQNTGELIFVPSEVEPPGTNVVRIDGLTPKSGLPDDCGNPPPLPDPDLDDNDFTRTIQICGTPQDTENQRCVNITIDFSPTLNDNGEQCFVIDGAQYCFTPDGVEKSDEPPPGVGDGSEEDGGGGDSQPDELEPSDEEDVEDKEETDPAIRYVTTEITTEPYKGKTILHSDPLDNDYFAGYFSWLVAANNRNYRTPQIPIRKAQQVFINSDRAIGYRIYTINGAKLKVTVYREKTGE